MSQSKAKASSAPKSRRSSEARETARRQRLVVKLRSLSSKDREPYQQKERDRLHAEVLGVPMRSFFHFTRKNLRKIVRDCIAERTSADDFRIFARGVFATYGAKNLADIDANHLDEVSFLFLEKLMKTRKANRCR